MAPGARNKFGAVLEPKVFSAEMYCIEESICGIVGTFRSPPVIRHPGHCFPLATPRHVPVSVQPQRNTSEVIPSTCVQLDNGTPKHSRATNTAGTDPASKVRGAISLYLVVKSHYGFTTVREIKQTSQHCCDKTMDGKMALYRECYFMNCTKPWSVKLLS